AGARRARRARPHRGRASLRRADAAAGAGAVSRGAPARVAARRADLGARRGGFGLGVGNVQGSPRPGGRRDLRHPSRSPGGSRSALFAPRPRPAHRHGRSGVSAFLSIIARDFKLAVRVGGDTLTVVLFFLGVGIIVPFAVGPDRPLLALLSPAIL